MPGVHADVRGSSGAALLRNTALLTMIKRAQRYCPELVWDKLNIDRAQQELDQSQKVISDERGHWSRKVLRRGSRAITANANPGEGSCEFAHPVLDEFNGQWMQIRRKFEIYTPKNVPAGLPRINL
jgi:hypothetical protein